MHTTYFVPVHGTASAPEGTLALRTGRLRSGERIGLAFTGPRPHCDRPRRRPGQQRLRHPACINDGRQIMAVAWFLPAGRGFCP